LTHPGKKAIFNLSSKWLIWNEYLPGKEVADDGFLRQTLFAWLKQVSIPCA